jgi:hypothetical protein
MQTLTFLLPPFKESCLGVLSSRYMAALRCVLDFRPYRLKDWIVRFADNQNFRGRPFAAADREAKADA